MCGIVGLLDRAGEAVSMPLLETMTATLAHRGPDGSGTWNGGAVGLGHRRLSIIDVATGAQPMVSADGRLAITFNGEIYNFRELRDELEGRGHAFRTRSDTEVILAAYAEWGESCVDRLRGMFAFAVADLGRRRLFLARDHLGIKPLFYVDDPRHFAFASELQALKVVPGLRLDLDPGAVDLYLRLQYVPGPQTIYRQARKLCPGHRLMVDFTGGARPPQRYWQLAFDPDRSLGEEEWLERLDHALTNSVRAHLVADVPVGAFLSGGVDSSLVVSRMAGLVAEPVRTFSIGFSEEAFDELRYARVVAERWGTDHHEEILQPDALAILPTLVRHYGEPFGDYSAIPTYYVSRLAASAVSVVLSGDGGDELFAGYTRYDTWLRWLAYAGVPAWKRLAYPLAHRLRPRRYPPRVANATAWLQRVEVCSNELRARLWRPEHAACRHDTVALFEEECRRAAGWHPVQLAQSVDVATYLPWAILTKVDVASMISSLEVRTPLVDRDLAELAARIPPELNLTRVDGRFVGKRLLRRLLARDFDTAFVNRPKMGFGVPLEVWFGPAGALSTTVEDRLADPASPLVELFRPEAIRSLLARRATWPLWLLLFLDEWLRQEEATTARG